MLTCITFCSCTFQYGHGVQRGQMRGRRAAGADGQRGGRGARRPRPLRAGGGGGALTPRAKPRPHLVPTPYVMLCVLARYEPILQALEASVNAKRAQTTLIIVRQYGRHP